MGAAFLSGLIKMSGALVGPWLDRVIPRAGLLGTIAGVAIVWIAMVPCAIIFTNPIIGLPVLFVLLLGFIGRYQFPFRLPAGLVAIGVGVLLGLITGDTAINFENTGFYPPVPVIGDLWVGLQLIWSKRNTIIMPDVIDSAVLSADQEIGLSISVEITHRRAGGVAGNVPTCQIANSLQHDLSIAVFAVAGPGRVLRLH